MLKKNTLLIMLLCWSASIFAQSKIGIDFGWSYSKIDFFFIDGRVSFEDLSENYDHKGFYTSINYQLLLSKSIYFEPSIAYAKRGAIITRNYGIVGYHGYHLHYLDFGAQLGVQPFSFLRISGGVDFSYLIKSLKYRNSREPANTTEFFRRTDIGLRPKVVFSVKNIYLKASYFHGLSLVRELVLDLPIPGNPVYEKTGYRNRSLEFSIGYQFELKKRKQ